MIKNKKNEKMYVGQTIRPIQKRLEEHRFQDRENNWKYVGYLYGPCFGSSVIHTIVTAALIWVKE